MVKFKLFDKKLKKYIMNTIPDNVWEVRHQLGIWSGQISVRSIRIMAHLIKEDKKYDLYIKVNNRFRKYTEELAKSLMNSKDIKDEEKIMKNILEKKKELNKKTLKNKEKNSNKIIIKRSRRRVVKRSRRIIKRSRRRVVKR